MKEHNHKLLYNRDIKEHKLLYNRDMKEHKLLYNRDIHIISVGSLTGSHRYYHLFLAIQDAKCVTFIFHEHLSLSCV